MGKSFFRFRRSIILPNGLKMNINKDSVSYTAKANNKTITINPNKNTSTKTINFGYGLSIITKDKIEPAKANIKVIEPEEVDKDGYFMDSFINAAFMFNILDKKKQYDPSIENSKMSQSIVSPSDVFIKDEETREITIG